MNMHDSVSRYGLSGMSVKMANSTANGYADETCPVCGEYNEGFDDYEFYNSSNGCGYRIYCGCPECGSRWSLEYTLDYAYIFYDGLADNNKEVMPDGKTLES